VSSVRQYLNNPQLDQQLAKEGFVVIPFLNTEEVSHLKQAYEDAHGEQSQPFYATAHHQDSAFRKKMSDAIFEVLSPHCEKVFNNCSLLGGSFISKSKDSTAKLQPHQDWNIVDENRFRSFNLWIPLVDLTEDNGAIEVLPNSHEWVRGYRHSSIDCAYRKVHDLVWENMKPLYIKAGEALIYDHSLLHASTANNTDELRIACASGVKPNEAEMFFYWNNSGVIEQYSSDVEFFMTQNIFQKPTSLQKVGELQYDFPTVEVEQLYSFLGKELPREETSIAESEAPTPVAEPDIPFWKVYTPMNILREIHYRITSKSE
jgi:hypothetical protein